MKQREININSNDNTLFVTEQCNNKCIMCCQPPKTKNDIDSLFIQNVKRIVSAPKKLECIGITGGEPTLLGDKLIELIKLIRFHLPSTTIHLLTNGRNLSDPIFTEQLAKAGEGMIIWGIPLHSDYEKDHDIIAGARGAYVETIHGLYNLAMNGACIELRVVMNKLNFKRFLPMAQFIQKNLSFVDWTAFMGMERVGFADLKSENIWIEPSAYISELRSAVYHLDSCNEKVAIYNVPLCLLPSDLHRFAKKSISDWKNYYPSDCDDCILKDKCCGLFTTSSVKFEGIHTIYGKV